LPTAVQPHPGAGSRNRVSIARYSALRKLDYCTACTVVPFIIGTRDEMRLAHKMKPVPRVIVSYADKLQLHALNPALPTTRCPQTESVNVADGIVSNERIKVRFVSQKSGDSHFRHRVALDKSRAVLNRVVGEPTASFGVGSDDDCGSDCENDFLNRVHGRTVAFVIGFMDV